MIEGVGKIGAVASEEAIGEAQGSVCASGQLCLPVCVMDVCMNLTNAQTF